MRKKNLLALYIIVIVIMGASAQEDRGPGIAPDLSTDTITIGKPVEFSVKIPVSSGVSITPPEREDFHPFSVISLNTERTEGKNIDTLSLSAVVTRYDTDSTFIPRLPFVIQTENDTGTGDTVFTQRVDLLFRSVIEPESGDTADKEIDVKGLKPLQEAGEPPRIWLWISAGLILIALIILIVVLLGNYRKKENVVPEKPPYEEAVEALKALNLKKMIEQGLLRAYVFELSAILKRYLGRRYRINASEFTTDEMIEWASGFSFKEEISEKIQDFFRSVHPVKFAKVVPERSKVEDMTKQVWSIVEDTKPVEKEAENGV